MSPGVIEVEDTGCGIEADFLPYIFIGFARRIAVRHILLVDCGLRLRAIPLECMEGTITAHSAGVAQGATFTVRLPVLAVIPTPHWRQDFKLTLPNLSNKRT